MSSKLISSLFGKVVADVVNKSREEFLGEGLDASVLQELQVRWERKLAAGGAVPSAPEPAAPACVAPAPPARPARQPAASKPTLPASQGPPSLLGRPAAFLPTAPAVEWMTDLSEPPAPLAAAPPPAAPPPASAPAAKTRKRKASAPAPPASARAASAGGDKTTLDSDDDEKDPETTNLVLTQFEKVSHVKNKWKCLLRNGVMSLNGKDYVFSSATGDFSW